MVSERFTNIIKYVGKNIKPWHPIVGVAVAELFFRPLFTMMDKKASMETKKYTATREALTEVVAAATYIASNAVALKIAEAKFKNNPEKLIKAKHNLSLIGLWTAASLIIPAVTSLTIKPVMGKIFKNDKKETPAPEIKPVEAKNNLSKPLPQGYSRVTMTSYVNTGMRV